MSPAWAWGDDQQESFDKLKNLHSSPPNLSYPDYSKSCILRRDGSARSLGGVLSQVFDGQEIVVAFGSHTLHGDEVLTILELLHGRELYPRCSMTIYSVRR